MSWTTQEIEAHLEKYITLGDPDHSTLSEALTTIGNDEVTLTIPAGTVSVSSNITIPVNINLRVLKGGVLSVANGITLTINGTLEAGPYQIFSWTGTGKVAFGNRQKLGHAEWWGAKGDNSTDCTSAVNAACASGLNEIRLLSGIYKVTNVVIDNAVTLVGSGSSKIKQTSTSGICIDVSPSTPIDDFGIRHLQIEGAATSAVGGNHGVYTKNIRFDLTLNNVLIKSFGEDGFRSEGNVFGFEINQVHIYLCYGIGFHLLKTTNRANGGGIYNLKIYDCNMGVKVNDCYSINFYNLLIEDDLQGMATTSKALEIYNTSAVNVFGAFIEWNYTNSILIDINQASNINIQGMRISSSDQHSSLVEFVKLTSSSFCSIINTRISWWGSGNFARAINISNATCLYNKVGNNRFDNFTVGVADSGQLNDIDDLGYMVSDVRSKRTNTSDIAFGARVSGENYRRWSVQSGGTMTWGSGSASPDTNFYRAGAGLLKSDGKILAAYGLGVGNASTSSPDVTGTSKTHKIQVFDANGDSLGYLQVYSDLPPEN